MKVKRRATDFRLRAKSRYSAGKKAGAGAKNWFRRERGGDEKTGREEKGRGFNKQRKQ